MRIPYSRKTGIIILFFLHFMKQSFKTWLAFWTTSWIITTLGLMIWLSFWTHMKIAVIGGILTITIADAFSDALGVYIFKESDRNNKVKEIRKSTFATFVAKFLVAMTFAIPVLMFESLLTATIVSAIWWLLLLSILSWYIAKRQKKNPLRSIVEHVWIAIIVIIVTYFVGVFISNTFGE